MFEDEPAAKKPVDLERLSVGELHARIEALKAEIAACNAELERKKGLKSDAEALFGDR